MATTLHCILRTVPRTASPLLASPHPPLSNAKLIFSRNYAFVKRTSSACFTLDVHSAHGCSIHTLCFAHLSSIWVRKDPKCVAHARNQMGSRDSIANVNPKSKRTFSSEVSTLMDKRRAEIHGSDDLFFGSKSVSWESLGVDNAIIHAVKQSGFQRPSAVQERAIPSILTGKDVILAAETGSGKTLSYLLPIFHMLIARKSETESSEEFQSSQGAIGTSKFNRNKKFGIVLCPNAMLCKQVESMAENLKDENGVPLLSVVSISRGESWPVSTPDLIVTTPASLLNYIVSFDPKNKRRVNFLKNVKHLIVDEADMLLTGGFENTINRVINFLKFEEKSYSLLLEEGGSLNSTDDSANSYSSFSLDSESDDNVYEKSVKVYNEKEKEDREEDDEFPNGGTNELCIEDQTPVLRNEEHEEEEEYGDNDESEESVENNWNAEHKSIKRGLKWKDCIRSKQYVFVAATLPENGTKSVAQILKKMFPDAIRVNGRFLHMQNPRLQQFWIQTTEEKRNEELFKVIANLSSYMQKNPSFLTSSNSTIQEPTSTAEQRILIFANTTRAVDSIGKYLASQNVDCAIFHRDVDLEDRVHALDYFKTQGGVLICTDSAARGIDVSHVQHVIQAEFATSAVDYLHRVGRTARAGKEGCVTNFFTASNKPLVDAVKSAITNNLPVENAFSRGRSFTKKLKKYGPSRRGVPGKPRTDSSSINS